MSRVPRLVQEFVEAVLREGDHAVDGQNLEKLKKIWKMYKKWPAKRAPCPFVDEAIFCTFAIVSAIFPKNWP